MKTKIGQAVYACHTQDCRVVTFVTALIVAKCPACEEPGVELNPLRGKPHAR